MEIKLTVPEDCELDDDQVEALQGFLKKKLRTRLVEVLNERVNDLLKADKLDSQKANKLMILIHKYMPRAERAERGGA